MLYKKTSLNDTSPLLNSVFFYSKRRLFRLSTSAPMDIHLVRVPQDVDVVNVRWNLSQRNEENVQHFFQSMLTAMYKLSFKSDMAQVHVALVSLMSHVAFM